MKEIIIINGMAESGKDTFAEMCSELYKTMNISSVDEIKMIGELMGASKIKDEKTRKFYSELKKLHTAYNDGPYNYMKRKIDYFKHKDCKDNIMFIHIREPEEINRVKNDFGCTTLLIRNPRVKKIDSNDADANVENYQYDYYVNNDGTLDDLRDKVYGFVMEAFGCN